MSVNFLNAYKLAYRSFSFLPTIELLTTPTERLLMFQWLWFSINIDCERKKI